ncbi:MAG TPA: L,D-transpeptidase [Nocardioides sp.]|jgi:hypothetical protein|nr:L,D-transpeptidase [Nocardioides sp.]
MSHHRRDVRPRYGRIGVLAAAVTISVVAALAGFGVLATSSAQAGAGPQPASHSKTISDPTVTPDPANVPANDPASDSANGAADGSLTGSSVGDTGSDDPSSPASSTGGPQQPPGSTTGETTTSTKAVPADSGTGRRIVFSQSLQRVWLLGQQTDDVEKSYLVSGSVTDNLQPGTYSVYSKSRWAVGIDDSGVMQYFVRFTQGPTGAAIGFHSIPTKNGVALQSRAQLGTPESHGCIRQYLPDAIALWNFAPIGTKVVVVA